MHKRKHGRVRAKGVAGHLRDGAQLITGLSIENLSMGGAFIRTATPMTKGAGVVVDLVKPGMKKSIRLTGRVASVVTAGHTVDAHHVPGMGVQFDALPDDVTARLRELLLALASEPAALEADAVDPLDVFYPPEPQALELEPTAPPGVTPLAVGVPESAKLMVQVRGLMMELGDWQAKVSELERKNGELEAEIDRLHTWIRAATGREPPRKAR